MEFSIKRNSETYLPKCQEQDCWNICFSLEIAEQITCANIEIALATTKDMTEEFLLDSWNAASHLSLKCLTKHGEKWNQKRSKSTYSHRMADQKSPNTASQRSIHD